MERIALTFSSRDNNDDSDLIAVAQAADRLGYESFWTGESWGRDAFTVLTMLACHTERIGLGTGIVTVYSRTPGLIAQSIASLDQISGGRAILGLGSSGRIVVEDWHGVKFDHPVGRTAEYIDIIRMALSGERVNYEGSFYELKRFRMGVRPVQERIPIYVASLGRRNLELTGRAADGWLPIWTPFRETAAGERAVDEGGGCSRTFCVGHYHRAANPVLRQRRRGDRCGGGEAGQGAHGLLHRRNGAVLLRPVLPIWLSGRMRRAAPGVGRRRPGRSGGSHHRPKWWTTSP